MLRSFRQIITFDSILGHKYTPGIKACLQHGDRSYLLETDQYGFRNSLKDKNKPELRIVFLGDSFTAGEGVSNQHRFTDLIQEEYDCEIFNLAVSDYGIDQQVLAYQEYGKFFSHDLVVLMPYMDDFDRTLRSARIGIETTTGRSIKIPKPYYEFSSDQLILKNSPVPKTKNYSSKISKKVSPVKSFWSSVKDKMKIKFPFVFTIAALYYRLSGKSAFTWTNDKNAPQWKISLPLIQKLKKLALDRPVLIVPIPYNKSIALKESSIGYMNILKAIKDSRTQVSDLNNFLVDNYSYQNEDLFLKLCGHFSINGNKLVAQNLAKVLQDHYNLKPRIERAEIHKSDIYVLGISCFYHDSASCLIKNGKVIAAAQEERFSRIKNDKSFPLVSINYCLEEAQVHIDELKSIVYYDFETWSLERALWNNTKLSKKRQSLQLPLPLLHKLKFSKILRNTTSYSGEIYTCQHHISHAAGAYFTSGIDNAAILVIDGVGEWACTSIALGDNGQIKLLKQQFYPHSLGLLYSAFTYFLGFKVNSGEYKVMGLAPYGSPVFYDIIIQELVSVKDDGSFEMNMKYFSFQDGEQMTNEHFSTLFEKNPRKFDSTIEQIDKDIAASIQKVTQEIIVKLANHAHKISKCETLIFTGGVALNCVANGLLFEETPFKSFYFQPAAGDAGGAMGAALQWYYENFFKADFKESKQDSMLLGPEFSNHEIVAFLDSVDCTPQHFKNADHRAITIAKFIKDNKIVGYFDGRMEFGPRALGSRSILGNPLNPKMKEIINAKIKFREDYRPFAPVYLEEKTVDYFEFDQPSPHMTIVRKLKDRLLKKEALNSSNVLPSITHIDNTARLQSVNEKQNPRLYSILSQFEKLTGYGVLINTSFNIRGEPIVCTPNDAYQCFRKTDMDILVLGDYYLIK